MAREIVYWDGLLSGDISDKVHCTVQAWAMRSPGLDDETTYTDYKIINVAKAHLPDGVYDLETHGERLKVCHEHGDWICVQERISTAAAES